MLEPYAGKLACPVLRRVCEMVTFLRGGNTPGLSGVYGAIRRLRVVKPAG